MMVFLRGDAPVTTSRGRQRETWLLRKSTLRSQDTRLRARYREVLRAEVRRTVEHESEVEPELRELLRILTSS